MRRRRALRLVLFAVSGLAGVSLAAGGATAGSGAGERVTVRWLGVAGVAIASGESVVLHDPYFSRPGLWTTLFSRYRPDPAVLAPLLAAGSPAPELAGADLIVIGHSHFDHLGDAPWIAAQTGARVAGSATTVHIAQGYGLAAAQTRELAPGASLRAGVFAVRAIESRHAPVILGRVPLPGEVSEPPQGPIHAFSFVLGDARAHLVTLARDAGASIRIALFSSANVHEPALADFGGEPVDLLLAATQGRTERYVPALVRALRPRIVVPIHFGDFFRPLDAPDAAEPRDPEDLALFEAEVAEAAASEEVPLEIRRLSLFEALRLPAD